MTDEKQIIDALGAEAAKAVEKISRELQESQKSMIEASKNGLATKEMVDDFNQKLTEGITEVKEIARKQGLDLSELSQKLATRENGEKSLGEQLRADEDELKKIYQNRSGVKEYMITVDKNGKWGAKPFDSTKAAGAHGTIQIDDSASMAEALSSAAVLRMGANAAQIGQFRNSPFLFDLCNVVPVSSNFPLFTYMEEQTKLGASAAVAEGGTKPKTQYIYNLKAENYKKEATLLAFTEEFSMDFARLQADIQEKGRIDVLNRVNTAILGRLLTAATAYDGTTLAGAITNANEFDVIAALAAQAEAATFANMANAAIMDTTVKYKMGLLKDNENRYLNPPAVLNNIAFVSNPSVGDDDIIVGDFKQYNVAFKGGLILRVGYNGTDFAENKFSMVIEQFYFDWIADARKAAIVKGTTFAEVKQTLSGGV